MSRQVLQGRPNEPPSTVDERSRPGFAILVGPSPDEFRRVRRNEITPYVRFHYRYIAADHAWAATELMPNGTDELAWRLWTAGSWLKYRDPQAADRFYKALVRRCRNSDLGSEADRIRWFPRAVSQN